MRAAKHALGTIACCTVIAAGSCLSPDSDGLSTLPSPSASPPEPAPGPVGSNTAQIDIEKSINGSDADSPPGPSIVVGDPVRWVFEVHNVGATSLTTVAVTDDVLGMIVCPSTELAVGASMMCTAAGVAAPGPHISVGTVTAASSLGSATDSDASHYVGVARAVEPPEDDNEVDDDTEEDGDTEVDGDGEEADGNQRDNGGERNDGSEGNGGSGGEGKGGNNGKGKGGKGGKGNLVSVDIGVQLAHLAHGDGVPGGLVPNQVGMIFGLTCSVVPSVQ